MVRRVTPSPNALGSPLRGRAAFRRRARRFRVQPPGSEWMSVAWFRAGRGSARGRFLLWVRAISSIAMSLLRWVRTWPSDSFVIRVRDKTDVEQLAARWRPPQVHNPLAGPMERVQHLGRVA